MRTWFTLLAQKMTSTKVVDLNEVNTFNIGHLVVRSSPDLLGGVKGRKKRKLGNNMFRALPIWEMDFVSSLN